MQTCSADILPDFPDGALTGLKLTGLNPAAGTLGDAVDGDSTGDGNVAVTEASGLDGVEGLC